MKFLLLLSFLVALLQDGYGNYCSDAMPHCADCWDTSECEECEEGYDLSSDYTACTPPSCQDPDCSDCENADHCDLCQDGYGFDSRGECSLCTDYLPHCAICYYWWECYICEEGFEVNSDNSCSPTTPTCSVTPRPIQHYPDLYRGSIIFVDFPFQCGGSVSGVEFYAERAGIFYFSAWRPSANGDSWTLLGYNAIVSEGEGAQIVPIPSDEQMIVEATDVFGFFYERGVRYRVISSEKIKKRARNGTSSRFVHTRETLEDLSIGVSRSNLAGGGNTERIVPINAIIS